VIPRKYQKKNSRARFIYSSERGSPLPPHLRIRTKSEKRGKQVELNVVLRGVVMVCLIIGIRPRKILERKEKRKERKWLLLLIENDVHTKITINQIFSLLPRLAAHYF
jgi:hypothetical protein